MALTGIQNFFSSLPPVTFEINAKNLIRKICQIATYLFSILGFTAICKKFYEYLGDKIKYPSNHPQKAKIESKLPPIQSHLIKVSKPAKGREEIKIEATPQYQKNDSFIQLATWPEESLDEFLKEFDKININETTIQKNLDSMDEQTMESLLKKMQIKQLSTLWRIESITLQSKTEIELRNIRLNKIFKSLSIEQLYESKNIYEFLVILANHENGCSQVAALSFDKTQIKTLSDDYKTHQYLKFVVDNLPITIDSLPILKILVENVSPWLETSLNRILQIKLRGLVPQETRKNLLAETKRHLKQSYMNQELFDNWAVFKMKNPNW